MYLKRNAFIAVALVSVLLLEGCASHADEEKLDTDVLLLTQKMNALTAELKTLKAKQQQEQRALKVAKEKQNLEQKPNSEQKQG